MSVMIGDPLVTRAFWRFESVYWQREQAELRASFLRETTLIKSRDVLVRVVPSGQHFDVEVGANRRADLRGVTA